MTDKVKETVRIITNAMKVADDKTASNIYNFAKGLDTMIPIVEELKRKNATKVKE